MKPLFSQNHQKRNVCIHQRTWESGFLGYILVDCNCFISQHVNLPNRPIRNPYVRNSANYTSNIIVKVKRLRGGSTREFFFKRWAVFIQITEINKRCLKSLEFSQLLVIQTSYQLCTCMYICMHLIYMAGHCIIVTLGVHIKKKNDPKLIRGNNA